MRFRRHREAADASTARLLIGFAVVVLAVVGVVNGALALTWKLTFPLARGYPTLFFETNTAVVLMLVLGGCWVETLRLKGGGAHVARMVGARPAQPSGSGSGAALERRLVNVITELSIASRMKPPAAWVLPRDGSINAFAAGWAEDDTVIGVTQGALERLTREELQGLVGHELGHLASGDTRLHMRLIGLVWGLQMVHGLGRSLLTRDERGQFHAGALVGMVLWTVGWVGWLGGRMLQAAVSRQREFHADAAAVQFTRQVAGIGGALRKIAGLPPERPAGYAESVAHLWVSPQASALSGSSLSASSSSSVTVWRRWLATHPPLHERLTRLYGRKVEPLAAPPLPVEDEALLPVAAWAASPASAGDSPAPLRDADSPVADAGDTLPATSPPRTLGWLRRGARDLAREQEALARAAFWRSPGERHAALLAWLLWPQGEAAPWDAWQAAVGPAAYSSGIREDVLALGPASGMALAERLAERDAFAGTTGVALRERLVRDAHALAPDGALRLRRLWLLRHLRAQALRPGRLPYDACAKARHAAAALLSTAMGLNGARWHAALPEEERSGAAPAPAALVPQTTRATATTATTAAGLRRLHPMHRPRLAKAWAAAASQAGLGGDLEVLTAVALGCRLLGTPCPDTVAAALGDRQAQERIL